jgi:putative flippase GtrA
MRAVRFVGVGFVGFVMQLLALAALTQIGVHYSVATVVAVELAILHNFIWHQHWTWRDRRAVTVRAAAARLAKFNAASGAVSIAGNVGLTFLFVELAHLPLLVANTLAVATLALVNYTVADRFVFVLFGPERDDRIDAGRASGGNVAREQGDAREGRADDGKGRRICRLDAEEQRAHEPREGERAGQAEHHARCSDGDTLTKHPHPQIAWRRS